MSRLDAMTLMKELADARTNRDVEVFFNEVLSAFGGISGFAKEYAESIKAADRGSSVQLGALNNLTRALFQFGQMNNSDEPDDEASVLAELKILLAENKSAQGGNGDGS